jgi:hypothetical protein
LSALLGVVAGGPTGVVAGARSVPWLVGVCVGSAHAGLLMHAVAVAASAIFQILIGLLLVGSC